MFQVSLFLQFFVKGKRIDDVHGCDRIFLPVDPMDGQLNISDAKAALRSMMNIKRRAVPEKQRKAMSEAIAGHAAAMPEIVEASHMHLYLSIPQGSEVSTGPLVEKLDAAGKLLSVPVVRDRDLVSANYRKGDALRNAGLGQPEPVTVSLSDEASIDVVLMPLLAFDGSGFRIGYGKGFYDRFLGRLAKQGFFPLRIGLAFTMQMVERVPLDSWDEPLDGVVHEHGVLKFR